MADDRHSGAEHPSPRDGWGWPLAGRQAHRAAPPTAVATGTRRRLLWLGLFAILALSTAYFLYRGPYRAFGSLDGGDLRVFYTASLAWLLGANPYDAGTLAEVAARSGIPFDPSWSLNPPTTFVLLAPVAALPWAMAQKAWIVANVLLEAACVAMAMSLAGLDVRRPRGLLFLAFVVALAPFHTAINEGQVSIAAATLVVASLWAIQREHEPAAGAAVALAVALKPQMTLVLLLLLLVRGHWRALAVAAATLAALLLVAIARLAAAGVDWLPALMSNVVASGFGDPTAATSRRLNLQPLLNLLLPGVDPVMITVVTGLLGSAALVALFGVLRHRRDREANLLAYAGCSVVMLLMVYNRSYGAALLVLAVAWVFARFRPAGSWPIAAVVLAASSAFLVPGAAALATVELPAPLRWVGETGWWPYLELHQVIALIVVLAGILAAAARGRHGAGGAIAPNGPPKPRDPRRFRGARVTGGCRASPPTPASRSSSGPPRRRWDRPSASITGEATSRRRGPCGRVHG